MADKALVIREFINTRKAYILAEEAYKIADDNSYAAQRKFMSSRGYGSKCFWELWAAGVCRETLNTLRRDFREEYPDENVALDNAIDAAYVARRKIIEATLSIAPFLSDTEREIIESGIYSDVAWRVDIIDLAEQLDVSTILC